MGSTHEAVEKVPLISKAFESFDVVIIPKDVLFDLMEEMPAFLQFILENIDVMISRESDRSILIHYCDAFFEHGLTSFWLVAHPDGRLDGAISTRLAKKDQSNGGNDDQAAEQS